MACGGERRMAGHNNESLKRVMSRQISILLNNRFRDAERVINLISVPYIMEGILKNDVGDLSRPERFRNSVKDCRQLELVATRKRFACDDDRPFLEIRNSNNTMMQTISILFDNRCRYAERMINLISRNGYTGGGERSAGERYGAGRDHCRPPSQCILHLEYSTDHPSEKRPCPPQVESSRSLVPQANP
jgi:hypothetical protein